jgi:hypothetical protein
MRKPPGKALAKQESDGFNEIKSCHTNEHASIYDDSQGTRSRPSFPLNVLAGDSIGSVHLLLFRLPR